MHHLAIDDGELGLEEENGGVRVFCAVDDRGNYVSHWLNATEVEKLRRWLSGHST